MLRLVSLFLSASNCNQDNLWKLANIADALLLGRMDFGADIQNLGSLTLALMEPGSSIATADTLEPADSSRWGKEILDFLRHTKNASLAVLKHVRFHILLV